MAQTVVILNTVYEDVPAVLLDKPDGDVAMFVEEGEIEPQPPVVAQATPTIEVSSSGLITASCTQGAGKVSAGTKSATNQLATQGAKTVTPTKAVQTAVDAGKYTTGAVKVGAIPSEYIVPSGSQTVTKNDTYDVTNLASMIVNVSGGGSLPSGIQAFDAGTITVSADFTTTRQTFNHNLGVIPDLVMVFADGNIAQTYSMLFALRSTKMGYRSSAYNGYMGYHGNSTTTASLNNSNSTTYGVSNLTATSFQLASAGSSYYWRKRTYKYFAIKWAE